MERITAYRWRGQLFASRREAEHAIDERIGSILCHHASQLVRLEKYSATIDYLETHCAEIGEAARLIADKADQPDDE